MTMYITPKESLFSKAFVKMDILTFHNTYFNDQYLRFITVQNSYDGRTLDQWSGNGSVNIMLKVSKKL